MSDSIAVGWYAHHPQFGVRRLGQSSISSEPLRIPPTGIVRARPIRVVSDTDSFMMLVGGLFGGAALVPGTESDTHPSEPEPSTPGHIATFCPVGEAPPGAWNLLASALRQVVWGVS